MDIPKITEALWIDDDLTFPAEDIMALISDGMKGGTRPTDMGKSTMKNTPVGSGSRPTPSRHKIESSAPENAKTLGRDPGGSLS